MNILHLYMRVCVYVLTIAILLFIPYFFFIQKKVSNNFKIMQVQLRYLSLMATNKNIAYDTF